MLSIFLSFALPAESLSSATRGVSAFAVLGFLPRRAFLLESVLALAAPQVTG